MAVDGNWNVVMTTPMGDKTGKLTLNADGDKLTGVMVNEFGEIPLEDGEIDGVHLFWKAKMSQPMPMTLEFELEEVGDTLTGSVKLGPMGEAPVKATRG